MKTFLLILCLMFTCSLLAANLYRVVNQDGSVVYTDKAVPGAIKVDMSKGNSVVMPALNAGQARVPASNVRSLPAYQLTIVSPTHEQTIRNNNGRVAIAARLTPVDKGKFQLYLDGDLVQTSPAPSFQLQNVDRGEHSVQIKYLHHTGKVLASSKKHTFFLHQASVLINPN